MSDPRIWDISQRLSSNTPLWPGEPELKVSRHASISAECPVNIGAISLPLHSGTHADAPLHYSSDGVASADSPLEPYLGRCMVVDARASGARIEMQDCDWSEIEGEERVLFRTYGKFPHDAWDENFTAVAPDVIARLRDAGALLIGIDTPSLDPQNSKTMDAHHEVLQGDMRILEGLVLDDVAPGAYELIALPLAIEGADASPVRAILRELP
ncbi:arylformamidase [Aurantiacibacter sediminis]|uniref:Kynurenine formamidase n=1 Tax=Aurantiacibacter sediminis TaxID=2793064 RepID=A0ABS0N307_9SPHN|nr:arylformamidase [Aurantiacibacter sediminis]MBH5321670.1 arylformamidase [Aurantiacibacter sediminis]